MSNFCKNTNLKRSYARIPVRTSQILTYWNVLRFEWYVSLNSIAFVLEVLVHHTVISCTYNVFCNRKFSSTSISCWRKSCLKLNFNFSANMKNSVSSFFDKKYEIMKKLYFLSCSLVAFYSKSSDSGVAGSGNKFLKK